MNKKLLVSLAALLTLGGGLAPAHGQQRPPGQPTEISTLASTFLQRKGDGIFLLTTLGVAISTDDRSYQTVYSGPVVTAQPGTGISEVKAGWKKTTARYVRVTAKNAPAPASSPPQKATWLFADELVVQ